VITGGVRLTGVTRSAPSPYTTTAKTHDVGDEVQRCKFFSGTVAEIAEELMVDYAGVDAAYIPTADWTTEATTWAPEDIQRLITEPEGVKSIINEIMSQTLTWGFWFDEIDQEIKFSAIRPADTDEDVASINDDDHLVADSVEIIDIPDKIVNEVQVLFGQINPTLRKEDVENYRRGHLAIQADSQSENELNQRRVKSVFGRWHPASNETVVSTFATRTINHRSKRMVEARFKLERKDEDLRSAEFCDLTTLYIVTELGLPATVRMRVLQVSSEGEEVSYRAREDFFRFQLGRLAPELTGGSPTEALRWGDATSSQQETYMFLADEDGLLSDGSTGKVLT
jgi:hypothetical protein